MEFGFIGAGRMASACVKGLLKNNFEPVQIGCLSATGGSARALAKETGIQFFDAIEALTRDASIWVLGMKPYQLGDLPESLAEASDGKLIISMLAGVKLEKLQKQFPKARNWIRIMPNTPSQIGAGITGVSYAHSPSAVDRASFETMLEALGKSAEIDESHMDALTAVSGSGVAYVFEWAASMIAAGEKMGLAAEVSKALTLQTFLGASKLMAESTELEPRQLRDAVVSKGGTTEAALNVFADADQSRLIERAMEAAATRSKELSK